MIPGIGAVIGLGVNLFANIFKGHVPYSDYQAKVMPILQSRANLTGYPAVCVWYGEIIGQTPDGQMIRIADKETLAPLAGQTGAWESVLQQYVDTSGKRVDLYGINKESLTVVTRVQLDGSWGIFTPENAGGLSLGSLTNLDLSSMFSGLSGLRGIVFLIGAGVFLYFLFRNKQ